ncbi:hypothetical protein BDU57DRAFT_458096 [Ampelomyces quisqualis]|uniref:Uncharacterized protein n=1 Tax=Ampelomyces quisqualis TaxID=50730 RepID=A0A6A5QGY0_AMPQU|nr:hypothetical protein BDU57DRAFT_458096 [Ampelomyces quisqualis]
MPEAGATSATGSTTNLQPSLLEERRKWVKHDREVKLDLFLSLAEEVMFEVFEVGAPLPPSNMNAQEMLEAIDEHFQVFKFEAYHHAFCHFLNLHIDQFPSIEEFNQEYLNTMEDLLDHGHPLSNIQACSAYFSKLRCTQNPWVAQKLAEWDVQTTEVDCVELVKESPPWSVIRPLATKSSQSFRVESIPEQYLEDSSASDSDLPSDRSDASTVSSISVHSHDETLDTKLSKELIPQRQESVITTRSQEITIRVSAEDIAELQQTQDLRKELENHPNSAIPERGSSKEKVPGSLLGDEPDALLLEFLVTRKSPAQKPPPPHDPAHALAQTQPAPPAHIHNPSTSQTSLNDSPSSSSDDDDEEEEEEEEEEEPPLQTPQNSAWTYLYESKGGYLIPPHHRRATSFPAPTPRAPALQSCAQVADFVARVRGEAQLHGEKREKMKSWGGARVHLGRFGVGRRR